MRRLVALVLVAAPAVAMAVREFVMREPTQILYDPAPNSLLVVATATWILTQFACYAALRLMPKASKRPKRAREIKRDLCFVLLTSGAIALVTGISVRIARAFASADLGGILLVPIFIGYLALYTAAFEIAGRGVTVTAGGFARHASFFVLAALVLAFILSALVYSSWLVSPDTLGVYAASFALLFLVLFALIEVERDQLHLHHYFIAIPFALMCVFENYVSLVAQCAFLAVHLHGVAMFGVQDVFVENDPTI